MKTFIKKLLREAIERSAYQEWMDSMDDGSNYRKWSRENFELSNKYWSTYAHLYSKLLRPIKSRKELEVVKKTVPQKLKTSEAQKAFNMFVLYKEDVLDGILAEGGPQ